MMDRTVYILGRILGRMTTELKVDASVVLTNALKIRGAKFLCYTSVIFVKRNIHRNWLITCQQ